MNSPAFTWAGRVKSLLWWRHRHADDCVDPCVFFIKASSDFEHFDVGSQVVAIIDLARFLCEIIGFTGNVIIDTTKPGGTMLKLTSGNKIRALGWKPRVEFWDGIKGVCDCGRHQLDPYA